MLLSSKLLNPWRSRPAILTLGLLCLSSAVHAADQVIYTKEVTYCSTGRAVNADRFDIRYYPGNKSIGFDISARSVAANLNADLNIELYAYGKNYINITANLCDILGGALCPLPQYQFDGSFAYVLPDSLNIDLPGIAFTVPDLDAYAQIILINQDTGGEALCLGATLSNGHTVYMDAVRWSIIAMTIFAFIVALVHSFWPLSPYKSGPEWRFATILSYFQHVALCGFLSLDYPLVYKNFTFNFVWSQGLIYARPINDAINRMRYETGGRNVEGQTFNVIAENNVALFRNVSDLASNKTLDDVRSYAAETVPEVQEAPSFNLVSGIETSTSGVGVTYANAFMTVLIFFLLLCCLMIAITLIAAAGVAIYSAVKHKRTGAHNFRYFAWTNWLRIFLAAYTPLILFIFWQFLHKNDSGWAAVLLAAVTFVWLHLAIFGIYWHLSKVAHRSLNDPNEKVSLRWSTVTQQFKRSGQGYILLLAAAAFCSAAFVAFAQGHALVQLIPLVAIQLIVFIAFCIWRPFSNRWSNVLMIFLELFKLVSYGLLIAFYAKLEYNGIIKAVLGFVLIAVQGIMTVILFIVSVYNAFVGIIWGKEARDRAIAIHVNAMNDKSNGENGEKLARPFLHPRITGLENGNSYDNRGSYNRDSMPPANEPSPMQYSNNAAYPTYSNAYTSYGNGNGQAPPVSSLYLPTPSSPSQQDQAIHPPFASNHDSGSMSDRTVVADPLSEGPSNTSSSDLGKQKKGLKGSSRGNREPVFLEQLPPPGIARQEYVHRHFQIYCNCFYNEYDQYMKNQISL